MAEEALILKEEKSLKPDEILDQKPVLVGDQNRLWKAFSDLNGTRLSGFEGPQRLQIDTSILYALVLGEDPQEFLNVILELDRVYMQNWADNHPST